MGKLLPSILQIYFEADFSNMSPEAFSNSPKLKALEEVVNHLLLKTNNAKGEIRVPFQSLVNIFHGSQYLDCHYMPAKQMGKNRIFDFIFSQYGFLPLVLADDILNIFVPIMKSLPLLSQTSHEKCMLTVIFMHRANQYHRKKELKALLKALTEVFTTGELVEDQAPGAVKRTNSIALELLNCCHVFVTTFQHPESVPAHFKPAKD